MSASRVDTDAEAVQRPPAPTHPTQEKLWIWLGENDDTNSIVLAVLVQETPERVMYRPLIAGSPGQAESMVDLAVAAAEDLGLKPVLAEYELVRLHALPGLGGPS